MEQLRQGAIFHEYSRKLMTDVHYFPGKFFKVNDRGRYIYVDIHDG